MTSTNSFASRSFRSNHRFVALMVSIAVTAGLMVGLVADASATESAPTVDRKADTVTVCTRRDMVQGKVGEKVWTCETIHYTHHK